MERRRLLVAAAALSAVGFGLTMLVAFHTARGLELDRSALARLSGAPPVPAEVAGRRVLATIDGASLIAEVLALFVLGLIRRRTGRAVGAAAIVVLSVGSAEALKHWLIPHVPQLLPAGRPATLPSGHTAVACSVGLGLVVAAPEVLRPLVALAGAAYAAGIAYALVILGWHFPSDVVASFFLCGTWTALVALTFGGGRWRWPSANGVGLAVVATGAALVVALIIASRHPAAADAARSQTALLAAGVALGVLSLCVFGLLTPLVSERR